MSYNFYDDFSFHDEADKPYKIVVERNSDLEHGHANVIENDYHILVCGNKHFANTPLLKNFDLELSLNLKTSQFEVEDNYKAYGFRIFFRYDRFLKEGYLLEGGVSKSKFHIKLLTIDCYHQCKTVQELESTAPETFDHSNFKVMMSVKKNHINICIDNIELSITDNKRVFQKAGSIGLDKTFYPGELIVKELFISSKDKIKKSAILGPLNLELPKVQGMSVPYQYTLNINKYENGPYELDIKLEGGIKDRPYRGKLGGQWCHEIDMMKNPYVRIHTHTDEFKNIILFNGLRTFLDKEEKRSWVLDRYEQIKWPLERKVYVDSLPDLSDMTFAVGYDYFFNDPKRFLAGGPFEVLSDSKGKILYHGHSLRKGNVAISVKSSDNKRICSMIPEDIPDHEKALLHARENHYFYEKEKIVFNIKVQYHLDSFFPGEFKIYAQLQNVYGDNLANNVSLKSLKINAPEDKALKNKLGIDSLDYKAEVNGVLDTGVYHLNLKITQDTKEIYLDNIIFEVMSPLPDAKSPPIASGLPALFSIPNEIKYLHTDAFDPLYEKSGAMHYFSISCFNPDYARKKHIWKLLELYKREWFLPITKRDTPNDISIEKNKDIIAHCDYLQIPPESNPRHGRYELWKEDIYQGNILDILIDFFKKNSHLLEDFKNISIDSLIKLQKTKKQLPQNAFIELVNLCWNDWLKFFSDNYSIILKKQYNKLRQINDNVKTSTGGPFPIYASHNKSAYFLNYFGHNIHGKTQQFYNGFWQFEDYPHSCGYSFSKAPFAMMTIKMHYSNWKLFPEIYSTMLLDGCNDGAVSQAHPPYGFYTMPVALMRERIYEYCFATVWFNENKFHYWQDNGFHLRNPRREYINELLRAWGNVLKHKPSRPVKTTCFLADVDIIAKHPDHYENNCNIHAPWKDVINTAEEALVYTYSSARNAGIPAGFSTRLEDLKSITPDMTDLIVLPPLNKNISQEHIDTIRKLHQQGINLLGFENVDGLEDLFGVKPFDKEVNIQKISVDPKYVSSIGQVNDEFTEHELCKAYYANNGADILLSGSDTVDGTFDVPVLLTNRTKWGKTAFFNVPPTVVKRDSFIERIGYGQECVSVIMKAASNYIIKELSRPVVEINSENAKLIAFYDENKNLVIVVEQECLATPDTTQYPQTFLLTVNVPGIKVDDISCDEEFSIVSIKKDKVVLRMNLGKYESALFKLKFK